MAAQIIKTQARLICSNNSQRAELQHKLGIYTVSQKTGTLIHVQITPTILRIRGPFFLRHSVETAKNVEAADADEAKRYLEVGKLTAELKADCEQLVQATDQRLPG